MTPREVRLSIQENIEDLERGCVDRCGFLLAPTAAVSRTEWRTSKWVVYDTVTVYSGVMYWVSITHFWRRSASIVVDVVGLTAERSRDFAGSSQRFFAILRKGTNTYVLRVSNDCHYKHYSHMLALVEGSLAIGSGGDSGQRPFNVPGVKERRGT